MAKAKKTAGKGKKKAPAPRPKPAKPAAKAGKGKAAANPVAAAKKAAQEAAAKARAAEKLAAQLQSQSKKEAERAAREMAQLRQALEKERQKLEAAQAAIAAQRDATKAAEAEKKALEKDFERQRRDAQKQAEAERKAAEKAEQQRLKQEAKAAEEAAKAAAKVAAKKKPIPTTSLAAAPIFRPLTEDRPELAPLPPPAKAGHVDHQMLSAIEYGLFAAVNKTFGFAGQSVVKNAALRMLEYGYKRGWLPPRSKEPVRALNEFFNRLETMGYAERIHVGKRGESHVLEVVGLADFEAVHELRGMHYPLLPVFLGAMLEAIVDQYFQLKVTMDPIEWAENKRGFSLPFSMHERTVVAEVSRLPAMSRMDDFEE